MDPRFLKMVDDDSGDEYYRPVALGDFFAVQQHLVEAGRNAKLICGNTGRTGVEKYFRLPEEPAWPATVDDLSVVDISKIPELNIVDVAFEESAAALPGVRGFHVGACVPISDLISLLEQEGGDSFHEVARHMNQIAGTQVRNIGSWGGNLMLAHERPTFPSDMRTVLATLDVQLTVATSASEMVVLSMRNFLNYNMDGNLLVSMYIPKPLPTVVVKTFRAAIRHANAKPIVNMGVRIDCRGGNLVSSAQIVVAGVNDTLLFADGAAEALVGTSFLNEGGDRLQQTLNNVVARLEMDAQDLGSLAKTDHSSEYRLSLMQSFMYKFFLKVAEPVPPSLMSAVATEMGHKEDRALSEAVVVCTTPDPAVLPVSEGIPKIEARICAAGEAQYIGDLDANGYFGALVYSEFSRVIFEAMDVTKAMSMPGVVDVMKENDGLPPGGSNVLNNEFTFAPLGSELTHNGEVLGLVLADTQARANAAAKMVGITYGQMRTRRVLKTRDAKDLPDRVVTAAARADMMLRLKKDKMRSIPRGARRLLRPKNNTKGNPEAALQRGLQRSMVVSGQIDYPGQKHFYMDPFSVLAEWKDNGQYIFSLATQSPMFHLRQICTALNSPRNKVHVVGKRVGGAFGARTYPNTRQICAVARACYKHKRSVRCQNERRDDMKMCGGKTPVAADYTATYLEDGTIDSFSVEASIDSGAMVSDVALLISAGVRDGTFNCYKTRDRTVATSEVPTSHPCTCRFHLA
jgi:CO/xanthine dehydrogenase FAD-binding subunit